MVSLILLASTVQWTCQMATPLSEEFTKTEFYGELREMVETDMVVAKIQAEEYKEGIKNADKDLQM